MKAAGSPWWLWLGVALLLGLFSQRDLLRDNVPAASGGTGASRPATAVDDGAAAFARAYAAQRSDIQLSGTGRVIKVLPDDNQGSRHQKLLVRLGDGHGQVILIAHNIDLAPRVDGIRAGDQLAFAGEYEWNEKGGVLHWTHHDPAGRHPDGWLRHNGRTYQ